MTMNDREKGTLEDMQEDISKILVSVGRIEERVKFQWWVIGALVTGYGAIFVLVFKHTH